MGSLLDNIRSARAKSRTSTRGRASSSRMRKGSRAKVAARTGERRR